MTREEFERYIASPAHGKSVERWPDTKDYFWPGQYKDFAVQLAWDVLQEAAKRERNAEKEDTSWVIRGAYKFARRLQGEREEELK